MSLQLPLRRVLDAVMPTFQSVDVRTFFACFDGENYNVATSIGFNRESVDSVNQTTLEHLLSLPRFESERLRFTVKVVPIDQWMGLIEEFKNGFLESSGVRIDLMRPIDLMDSKGYINSIRLLDRSPGWPSFESVLTWNAPPNEPGSAANKLQGFQHDSEIMLNLHVGGYRELKDLFHAFLQSRSDADPSYISAIYISAPVYASIKEIKFSPKESRLSTTIECHQELCAGIQVYGERESMHGSRERITFSAPECVGGDRVFEATVSLEDRTASVNLSLSHRALGYIAEVRKSPRELIPADELNPLWQILQAFCPAATFETMLTATPLPPKRSEKEQRAFERYVAWLLSLYGYSSIILGEFENLYRAPTKVQVGSIDIVAYQTRRNRVLLCSCTMGPPEERDYANLITVRSHLLSFTDENVSFVIELAIFSSAAQCATPSHYTLPERYIALFDRRDLKDSIKWLGSGIEAEFFRRLEPPIAWDSLGNIPVPLES